MTYYGFELRRDHEHLVVQYGLLDRRRTTVPIRRIQAVRIEESVVIDRISAHKIPSDGPGRAAVEQEDAQMAERSGMAVNSAELELEDESDRGSLLSQDPEDDDAEPDWMDSD